MLDVLESTLKIELVRYACGRAIFCPSCEVVLDAADAVLYTPKGDEGTAAILCGKCSDELRDGLSSIDEVVLLAATDIDDGRELHKGR